MIFTQEVNIYSSEAIIKRFRAVDTSIQVVQGKISAILTDSEILELQNSKTTMYSKLANAELKVDSLTLNFSDLTTKYNSLTGKYDSLDSKVADYKLGVDGLSADITAVKKNLTDNYSTTSAMNTAINASASGLRTEVSNTFATKTAMNTAKQDAINSSNTATDNKLKGYSTTVQMNSAISQSASSITSTVSANYVGKNKVISEINQSAESVSIKAEKINLEGLITANSNFKILSDGSMETIKGKIGGWEISNTSLKTSGSNKFILDASSGGIYTVRNNGNKGVSFIDDGILFYSWFRDGDYTGRLGTARESVLKQENVLYLVSGYRDNLALGVQSSEGPNEGIDEYIVLSDHDNFGGDEGITLNKHVHCYGDIVFERDIQCYGAMDVKRDIVCNGIVKSDSTYGVRPCVVGSNGHSIVLDWTGSQLNVWIDGTWVGKI